MNNVTLIGNVCRDFELRQTSTGVSIASNTLAVKRDRKDANGVYLSDFFDIYCFGAQADFAVKYLRKGDRVCIAGSVHIRDYTTRNGAKGRAVEVMVTSIENLTPKDEEAVAVEEKPVAEQVKQAPVQQPQPAPASPLDSIEISDDDLPF